MRGCLDEKGFEVLIRGTGNCVADTERVSKFRIFRCRFSSRAGC
jgi:hypothetical protein